MQQQQETCSLKQRQALVKYGEREREYNGIILLLWWWSDSKVVVVFVDVIEVSNHINAITESLLVHAALILLLF